MSETLIGNVRGQQGERGPQGNQGQQGPAGPQGSQGQQGPAGEGVPAGGNAGQVLTKIDGTDYNTAWRTPAGGIVRRNGTFEPAESLTTDEEVAEAFSTWVLNTLITNLNVPHVGTITLPVGKLFSKVWDMSTQYNHLVYFGTQAPNARYTENTAYTKRDVALLCYESNGVRNMAYKYDPVANTIELQFQRSVIVVGATPFGLRAMPFTFLNSDPNQFVGNPYDRERSYFAVTGVFQALKNSQGTDTGYLLKTISDHEKNASVPYSDIKYTYMVIKLDSTKADTFEWIPFTSNVLSLSSELTSVVWVPITRYLNTCPIKMSESQTYATGTTKPMYIAFEYSYGNLNNSTPAIMIDQADYADMQAQNQTPQFPVYTIGNNS